MQKASTGREVRHRRGGLEAGREGRILLASRGELAHQGWWALNTDHMLRLANQGPEPLAAGLGTNTCTGGQVDVEVLGREVGGRDGLSFKANGAASDGPGSAELGRVSDLKGSGPSLLGASPGLVFMTTIAGDLEAQKPRMIGQQFGGFAPCGSEHAGMEWYRHQLMGPGGQRALEMASQCPRQQQNKAHDLPGKGPRVTAGLPHWAWSLGS